MEDLQDTHSILEEIVNQDIVTVSDELSCSLDALQVTGLGMFGQMAGGFLKAHAQR